MFCECVKAYYSKIFNQQSLIFNQQSKDLIYICRLNAIAFLDIERKRA